MQIDFLLGPAGSGKTFRCITEAREALQKSPDGLPLILLAPKQSTFQFERQILEQGELAGYTRLKVLSFERLADFLLEHFEVPTPRLLSEEGRVMVLRALLAKKQNKLHLFRSSAARPGFARQLSLVLREVQHHQLTASTLHELAAKVGPANRLNHKLLEVAMMLQCYREWLRDHQLGDADMLLDLATETLLRPCPGKRLEIETLWMDGFAQLTAQERRLLRALFPFCRRASVAFCVDTECLSDKSWFSPWTAIGDTCRQLQKELGSLADCAIKETRLVRDPAKGRFSTQPMLQHLERHWAAPQPYCAGTNPESTEGAVRVVTCANPQAESTFVAKEILRHVRNGGRYRDTAVLVRHLDQYHDCLRRAFARYQIPFFIDRREPVGHHPLAELTRGALLTISLQWRHVDWFAALKSGLVHDLQHEIDWLENEALAHGWEGKTWHTQLKWDGDKIESARLEALRGKLVEPFLQLADSLLERPSGAQLSHALRVFWETLKVRQTLSQWTEAQQSRSEDFHAVHASVWQQMNDWLDNFEIAFSKDALPFSEWLPILEAGLSTLTIGVVPPVLDQVLIGAIDRSRNPDLQRVYLLGMNESVFPSLAPAPSLLCGTDRQILEEHGQQLGPSPRAEAGLERFLGYIACTRARRQVVLTYASRDNEGNPLNPSCFISHLERIFPGLARTEKFSPNKIWVHHEHPSELLGHLLQVQGIQKRLDGDAAPLVSAEALAQMEVLGKLRVFEPVLKRLQHLQEPKPQETLAPGMAARLYGPELKTSASQFEQFAACPFRFFVTAGLRAEERLKFELDLRQQGSFQHKVLEKFHQAVRAKKKRWRDLTPQQASDQIGMIADDLVHTFEDGLLKVSEQNQFLGRVHKKALQKLIQALIGWMAQYQFDPEDVEIGFGFENGLPPWRIDLGGGHTLLFCGRIDRLDLWRVPGKDEALCVVIDYKSSARELKSLYLAHGLHQQLPAYLNALRNLNNAKDLFGVSRLIPAGGFYVNLSGSYKAGKNRTEVLEAAIEASRRAYGHEGLLNFDALDKLDNRGANQGDQFDYMITKAGNLDKRCSSALPAAQFEATLDQTERILRDLGRRIYAGDARIDPYKHRVELACDKCSYQSICRIDPWTHSYRTLREADMSSEDMAEGI